jgi:Mor family transcriptional regulator
MQRVENRGPGNNQNYYFAGVIFLISVHKKNNSCSLKNKQLFKRWNGINLAFQLKNQY